MWDVGEEDKSKIRRVKFVRSVIALTLSLAGLYILGSHSIPLAESYLKGRVIEHTTNNKVTPVPGSYKREIGGEFAYWDPGRSYFENLIAQAGVLGAGSERVYDPTTQEYREVEIDTTYSRPMSITIPSLQIYDLNITSNVESYEEDVYNRILKNGLAHFQGTPLPGAGGNSFIYGHSAVPSYYKNHKDDPEVAFTVLEDIKIGDEVILEKDGEKLTYTVRKKRVVEPSDFSILERQSWKETVTLMTCHPIGIGANRLVVTAELKDG